MYTGVDYTFKNASEGFSESQCKKRIAAASATTLAARRCALIVEEISGDEDSGDTEQLMIGAVVRDLVKS